MTSLNFREHAELPKIGAVQHLCIITDIQGKRVTDRSHENVGSSDKRRQMSGLSDNPIQQKSSKQEICNILKNAANCMHNFKSSLDSYQKHKTAENIGK